MAQIEFLQKDLTVSLGDVDLCSGCSACRSICPVGAISMVKDGDGFLFPAIDSKKCIKCKLCMRACPYQTPRRTEFHEMRFFSAYSNDTSVQKGSSSGGVFPLLCKKTLSLGGVVYGCSLRPDLTVSHLRVDDVNFVGEILKSKYVQSDLMLSFSQVKADLQKGRLVLFSGTPCQINGLSSFLSYSQVDTSRLLLVSIACLGVPSQKLLSDYFAFCSKKYKKKISNYQFRHKNGLGENKEEIAFFLDGTSTFVGNSAAPSEYMRIFNANNCFRRSCYHCVAKEHINADVLLGDFWGIESVDAKMASKNGSSLIVALSQKGLDNIQNIGEELTIHEECSFGNNPRLFSSVPFPSSREGFYDRLDEGGFESILQNSRHLTSLPFRGSLSSLRRLFFVHRRNKEKLAICIITPTDMFNYGNRLQNFALTRFFETAYSAKVKTLWPNVPPSFKHRMGFFVRSFLRFLRTSIFLRFSKRSISYRKFSRFNENIKKERALSLRFRPFRYLNERYEYFVVGSDQVWHQTYGCYDSIASISFADKKKRISYAASMGKESISPGAFPILCHSFFCFAGLSVREQSEVEQIRRFYHRPISVNIDPVFLLTCDEWNLIALKGVSNKTKHLVSEGPFLFVYWVGEETIHQKKAIQRIALQKKLKIIVVRTASEDVEDTYVDCGPFDFLYLISRSSFVVSKSFHGTAFSLIFRKPFISVDSNVEGSDASDARILELQRLFSIPRDCFNFVSEDPEKIDEKKVEEVILDEKNRTKMYFTGLFARFFQNEK